MILATDAQIPFRRLTPNAIIATDTADAPHWYALPQNTDEFRPLTRALVYGDGDDFPVRLAAVLTDTELTFRVRLPADLPNDEQYVIHFQYDLNVFREIILGADSVLAQGADRGAVVDFSWSEQEVRVPFSLRELTSCRTADGSYSLLLFLSRRPDMTVVGAEWAFPSPVMTLPLRVITSPTGTTETII